MQRVRITTLYHTGTRQLEAGEHDLTADEFERAKRYGVIQGEAVAETVQKDLQKDLQKEPAGSTKKKPTARRRRGK